MDAKEYLSRAFVLDRRIKAKEKQLDALRDHVPYTTPEMGDIRVKTNMTGSSVEYAALRVVSLSDEIRSDIAEMTEVMKEIAAMIRRVGDVDAEVALEPRYLAFMSWDDVIGELGYSPGHVFRLHREALRRISSFL